MFAQLNVYKNLIIGGVIVALVLGLYFYVHSLKVQISGLRDDLKDSYVELAHSRLEASRYESALSKQSDKVERLRVDKAGADKKLAEWKAKPVEIRYNVIYKNGKVKSNECIDIQKAISRVRNIRYSEL